MGLFVRIEQATLPKGNEPKLLFVGELFATKAACVADVVFRDVSRAREFARIVDYPQWTESGVALFLRLLRLSGPIPELANEADGRVTVALADDEAGQVTMVFPHRHEFSVKGAHELLLVDIYTGWLDCSLASLEAIAADMHVIVSYPISIQDAICVGLADALGWGKLTRPVRRPLSSVGIRRTSSGDEYVLLRDVPPLSRYYLQQYLSLPTRVRTVSGVDWRAFLQHLQLARAGRPIMYRGARR